MDNDANKKLNDLFNKAKSQPSKVSFEEIKGQFLKNIDNLNSVDAGGKLSKFFNLKNWIIMITTISTLTLGFIMLLNNSTKPTQHKLKHAEIKLESTLDANIAIEEHKKVKSKHLSKVLTKKVDLTEFQSVINDLAIPSKKQLNNELLIFADSLKRYKNELLKSARITELLDTAYQFPKLTAEEIDANNKQKAKMFGKKTGRKVGKVINNEWYQPDPRGFLFIPMGNMKYDDKEVSVNAFYMKQTEVTNLEYRTFLFDLLIHDRKAEFLKAKPNQKMWTTEFSGASFKEMEENYFSHATYNDYPVVAISREGAEMYCKWMTHELNINNLNLINDFRLPSNYEWEYAASKGGKDIYSWNGMVTRQNGRGCFMANYKYMPELDTITITGCEVKYPNAFTTSGLLLGENCFTVKINSYSPNDFGLYCMSGNVAEMVYYTDEANQPGTRGGSWTSIGQELQIVDGVDRFKGKTEPSVNVGFRPVMTYMGRAQIKINPVGTVKIDNDLYMDETEITNFSWQEYLSWQANKYGKSSNEYKNALPDTLVWRNKESFNEPYAQYYFSHPAYQQYPVVGVSYEQAVEYCKWRTDRVKELFIAKALTDKKYSYTINLEYRLPTKEEWEKAAKIGYSEKTQQQLDTKYKGQLLANLKRNVDDNVVVAGTSPNNADITAPVKSYWPNAVGCYNLIGNVAEMTNIKGIAKGGSWINNPSDIYVEKEITYTKPTSWLGFRCVAEIKD